MERSRRRAFRIILLVVLSLQPLGCKRQEAPEETKARKTVQAQLVSSAHTVSPASSFKVGVLFAMEKPWHIYWKYPGPAGLATRIAMKLPAGAEASPVEWPVPKVFKQPGGVPGYGYEDQVLLVQEVRIPPSVEYGVPLTIELEARWLACADICVPGRTVLHETLQIGSSTDRQHAELFEKWGKRMPLPSSEFAKMVEQRPAGGEAGEGSSRKSRIAFENSEAVNELFIIPAPPAGVSIDKIETLPRGNASVAEISYNNFSSQPAPLEIDALVGFTNAKGENRVYETKLRLE